MKLYAFTFDTHYRQLTKPEEILRHRYRCEADTMGDAFRKYCANEFIQTLGMDEFVMVEMYHEKKITNAERAGGEKKSEG
jgi:hypothetical protein